MATKPNFKEPFSVSIYYCLDNPKFKPKITGKLIEIVPDLTISLIKLGLVDKNKLLKKINGDLEHEKQG